ncbi:hypothetical protein BN7_5521 [Wickerhamomyces ciferrii]|uniref:C2H2-type domain-containing protein n=1 Tax=Wickerhamomyces ciferrii (strain ATCC 14091 / BCRC 22168 / CBS 111 / JCM 3599 / NBRC 0793 / NRRL Y-1031 F-60-10) TaxID=1206466 RepID=K0KWR4_WICCF|nr:uncharacterized protein BN7_5521 [Wickerhamomyces ciferrii]CCH45934.1 hypothetical protein BN7_5521 [Wickerhamomyces ciferrii]
MTAASESKVKLPSIKELTIGLPTNVEAQRPRQSSIESIASTSPHQVYYQLNQPQQQQPQQPVIIASHPAVLPATTNGSISSNSSIFDNDPISSRKSSTASSVSPPFQSSTYSLPSTTQPSSQQPLKQQLPPQQHTPPQGTNYVITTSPYNKIPNQYPYGGQYQNTHMNPHQASHYSLYQHGQPHQQVQHYQPQLYDHNPHVQHPQYQTYSTHHHDQTLNSQPKKKRPRRKANEMERLYACNYNNCKNSYGTLNHLNAHITFKRHGPKRKPEEFKQIRELYKIKKNKLEQAAKEAEQIKQTINSNDSSQVKDSKIKLLANLSENFFDTKAEIAELPIFHQQRGYNGYGRHSYTLKQGAQEAAQN